MFSSFVLEIQCVFHTYSTSQFRPATFQVLNNHTWPGTPILGSPALEWWALLGAPEWHSRLSIRLGFSSGHDIMSREIQVASSAGLILKILALCPSPHLHVGSLTHTKINLGQMISSIHNIFTCMSHFNHWSWAWTSYCISGPIH